MARGGERDRRSNAPVAMTVAAGVAFGGLLAGGVWAGYAWGTRFYRTSVPTRTALPATPPSTQNTPAAVIPPPPAAAEPAAPASADSAPETVSKRGAPHGPRPEKPKGVTWQERVHALAWEAEANRTARYVGVYVASAQDDRVFAAFRADEDFPAASIIKVPVMLAVLDSRAKRRPRPDEDRLVRRMMQQSDNAATNALLDALGAPTQRGQQRDTPGMAAVNRKVAEVLGQDEPVTRVQLRLGVPAGLTNPLNRGCPQEFGELLRHLAARARQRDAAAREMIAMMRGSSADHRTRLPQGVPPRFRAQVANKTGTLPTVVADAALVRTPGGEQYVVAVVFEGVTAATTARAEEYCRQISTLCWNNLAGPKLTPAPSAHRYDPRAPVSPRRVRPAAPRAASPRPKPPARPAPAKPAKPGGSSGTTPAPARPADAPDRPAGGD